MASGPQHYAEAERLLEMVQTVPKDQFVPTRSIKDDQRSTNIIAAAQVHATLAQAAATIGLAHDTTPHIGSTLNADDWTPVLDADNT